MPSDAKHPRTMLSPKTSKNNGRKSEEAGGTSKAAKAKEEPQPEGESGQQQLRGRHEEFEFFYSAKSAFSQHYPASFQIDGLPYNCAEQYMMHQKAVLFKDPAMAKKIMACSNPVEQKRFGRKVQNFDKDVWDERCKSIVKKGNYAKFSQNPHLLRPLLATHPRTLVEASPRDRLWGIGMGASNPKARDRSQWKGRNLLGQILTEVREELRREEEEEEEDEEEVEEEEEEVEEEEGDEEERKGKKKDEKK